MLPERCASCHRPGLAARLPLLTYEDAAKRAQPISVVTQTGFTLRWYPELGYGRLEAERRMLGSKIGPVTK